MTFTSIGTLIGGLGLFLLGMTLMTDGLKLAAGDALRRILSRWTGTPVRGVLSGVLITSMVQSSSAVTVATIGFVNAGLLTLLGAMWVIFGANIGTTMTGWLVALIGFHVDIKLFALPAIGVGMALKLSGPQLRRGAIGEALAGFGVFFLGIDILKTAFEGIEARIDLADLAGEGFGAELLFVLLGFALTLMMQSSSAALAITLTAVAGGVIPLSAAAAVVIGANVGTTSTAILAVLGATPNAKRAAAAHVAFNLLTGAVAILILPWLLGAILWLREGMGLDGSPATTLALFHTAFNLLGVALIWPLAPPLARFLERQFRTFEEDEAKPRHLDTTLLAAPSLALNALALELRRVGGIAHRMARGALSSERGPGPRLSSDRAILEPLLAAVGQYVAQMQRGDLSDPVAQALPEAMQVAQYFATTAEHAQEIAQMLTTLGEVEHPQVVEALARFKGQTAALLGRIDPQTGSDEPFDGDAEMAKLRQGYDELKGMLLKAGARDELPVRQMVGLIDQAGLVRRMGKQAVKGVMGLQRLQKVGMAEGASA